jgi:N-acylneuraminate cytidylyltransferase/CMP-N,N'-diacetyllegionaminic acid synthase
MWLQPTSPFRSSAIIEQALELMERQQADGVIGCKEIHRDLTTLFGSNNGFLRPLCDDKNTQTSRQEIEPLLTPNGAMYLCKTAVLRKKKSFYSERTVPLVMDSIMSLDIDTLTDWAMAEAFVKAKLVELRKL